MFTKTMTKRTIGDLAKRPGLRRKAAKLEAVVRRAIRNGQLAMVCSVLVDKGDAVTGSRVPWATLATLEQRVRRTGK